MSYFRSMIYPKNDRPINYRVYALRFRDKREYNRVENKHRKITIT